MNVGDKVLVEATVTQVGEEVIAVAIPNPQRGYEHIRVPRPQVRGKPGRKAA